MIRHWTFGWKVGVGFAITASFALIIAVVAICSLREVVTVKDRVISVYGENLIATQRLSTLSARASAARRGFLLTKLTADIDEADKCMEEFTTIITALRLRLESNDERELITRIETAAAAHLEVAARVTELRKGDTPIETVARQFVELVLPKRQLLNSALDAFTDHELHLRDVSKQAATDAAATATSVVIAAGLALIVSASLIALFLTRSLGQQIGSAVGQIQSSSAELQAAANQQATGTKEQATAMSEIATTISELMATSRQIAESAKRVAAVAEQTATAAHAGDSTVQIANESFASIRRQVDMIVDHMLELGRKSQQIGAVLEIVSELAEQTNILAINATIEAVGAGETGRRFAVVADEIRKLADRVAGSTKEIRGLIDDVRSAVNTTVMATETGSKAVDAGNRQFGEVAVSFKRISDLVNTTTETSREIELSTKQQASAVEQVNVAIANVAQATRESETSSTQTLQTASQLATLSKDLLLVVQPRDRT